MHKPNRIGLGLVLFVGLFFARFDLISAQDGSKSGTSAGGQVFDSYPHPETRGAMRYSMVDKWSTTDLTYQFNNCPTLVDCDEAMNSVIQAFTDWSAVSALKFTEVSNGADIEIEWGGEELDMGPDSDTLGFAYFPSDGGDLFLNDGVEWEFGTGTDNDLYMTAAHEIGHALGLDHSDDPASLMYPTGTEETTGIASMDVEAIQALYGGRDGSAPELNVDNTPSSVPDSSGTEAVDGTLNDSTPYDLWEIDVEDGETLFITMKVVDGDLAPHLGVMADDEETVIAESSNDTATEAALTVTFPEAGTYVVVATRDGMEDGSSEGGYTLDIEEGDAQASTTSSSTSIEVANFTETDVCELYISLSDGEDWGDDLLEGQPLADSESFDVDLEAGDYDALAVTCDNAEIEEYGLSLEQGSAIEIYEDVIAVYP